MKIKTQRCLIRPFIEEDLDTFMTYRNDEAWMKYQDFKGYTKAQYLSLIVETKPHIKHGLQLAITNKDTGDLIGDLFLNLTEDICWLGYTIHPNYARQGYAYEAVKGIIPWVISKGAKKIETSIHKDNVASLKLIRKLNFVEIGVLDDGDISFVLNLI